MKKEITIVVPTDWSAITLSKYIQLQKDIQTYKDNEAAITAALFYHLCGVDAETVQKLDVETFMAIQRDLTAFISNTDLPFQQFLTIDGKEYGFEPNLSNMSYGAYVDLSKYESMGVNDKWAEAMSILYRPVTKKIGASYEIEKYSGKVDGEKFMDVTMNYHFGALSFFFHLLGDLQNATLKYLKDSGEIPHNMLTILEESGKLIPPSSN